MNKSSELFESQISPVSRVCLIGFMGAGKTVTAQALAAELGGVNWIDLDEFIEARENRSIRQIIENLGENVFREIETDALREAMRSEENVVIALGGGTWTIEANREIIVNANYHPVWLDSPFELCWKRISETNAEQHQQRPLAGQKTKTQQLFSLRRKIYQTAKSKVKISKDKTSGETAREIIKLISPAKPKRAKSIDKTA